MLFSLHAVRYFAFLFLLLISSFMPLWLGKKLEIISVFLDWFRLVLCARVWSIQRIFHVHLKRMYILAFWSSFILDIMSWKYHLIIIVLLCHLGSLLSYWFLSRKSVHWYEWGVKISYCYCIPHQFLLLCLFILVVCICVLPY